MTNDAGYSVGELAHLAGVTSRTIRYYAAEGLLPPPAMQGRYARYDDGHLQRLQLIARLKDAYLPLHEIRQRIAPLSGEQVASMLAELGEKPVRIAETTSAEDYIANVIARQQPASHAKAPVPEMLAQPVAPAPSAPVTPEPARVGGFFRRFVPSGRAAPLTSTPSETWRHIQLAPGVELHVREPIDAATQEQIQLLVARARELFE